MKLILYGLGQGLDLVEKRIKREHEIVGYMDSYAQISVFRGKPFYTLKSFHQVPFDYIVITVQWRKTAMEISHMLRIQYEIPENRIIPFYAYANYETYRIKLKEYCLETIQGLIFGNSHAECGYLEEELCIPFLNLAVSSQDIYYDYKTFQSCIRECGERLKNLSYVIIDLYDYYCFNCDTSMTNYIIDYVFWGGYLEEHNFKYNPNFRKSFMEELRDEAYMPDKASDMNLLFEDISVKCGACASDRWEHMEKDDFLKKGSIIKKAASNRHEQTVTENKKLLDLFLQEMKEFAPNIKIIFTLIPRYREMEQELKVLMSSWEKEFYDVINAMCKKYGAVFWNYKNRTDISGNMMFYYDAGHLNTTGARALTSILNEDLKKI